MSQPVPYDPASRESILAYAEKLVGHSLREILDELPPEIDFTGNKGGYGAALERHYFCYEPNNRPEPDFAEAGVELKATPLKRSGKKKLVAKERLVLGMIDYMAVVSEEWEKSSFLSKNSHLLLVFYLHEADKDPRDFCIKIVRLWDFPEEDLEIISQDWGKIVGKVKAGRAHELSEGDTLYLAACTKAATSAARRKQPFSGVSAKPRALSLKASYMNSVIEDSLKLQSAVRPEEYRSGKTFEQIVHDRFRPYIGMTADEIAARLNVGIKRGAKNFYAVLTQRIFGIDPSHSAEFIKADVIVRTVRLRPSGALKEAVSFSAFDYEDLVQQDWEGSDLRNDLTRRFFFVVYEMDKQEIPTLAHTQFWTMPTSDVDLHGRECFERTVELIMEGKADYLPKSSDNKVCHVRPHGRNSADTLPTPTGGRAVRKSFWLNQKYLAKQLTDGADS
ncbi:MAG: Sau3AI family type II restriction endonuclease [Coriobacteriia bacterium]|nr:Sau3AI family type II restriction endonuclease [Coriobacteriia bacterium]